MDREATLMSTTVVLDQNLDTSRIGPPGRASGIPFLDLIDIGKYSRENPESRFPRTFHERLDIPPHHHDTAMHPVSLDTIPATLRPVVFDNPWPTHFA
jgi:hypothetical protein